MRSAYIIAVAGAVAAAAQFTAPATPSERVAAELARSVQTFDANEPEALVKRILAPKLRRFAVLHVANKTYATRRFLRTDKNQGLVVALAAAKRRGAVLPNVAWAHVEEASGGPKGRCPDPRVPTTVIAKRNGYKQCGILIPNPYFPDRHHHLKMGDLDRWARQAASIQKAARKSPVLQRTPRAFWRGKCLAGSYLKAPNFLVDPPALYSHKHARRARKRPGRRLAAASEPCLIRGAGARARLLAAALTAARPDVVDAKCQVLAPPTNFSCARDRVALESALTRVTAARRAVVDERWIEAEDYAQHKFVLNLPGGTTGSYSRNLNRASAGSERRGARLTTTRADLWVTGSVVLMWKSTAVEWYYPALEDGVTHVSVDSKTAAQAIDALNGDDVRVSRLSRAAEAVHERFTCADCIASYYARALRAIRDHTSQHAVLDSPEKFIAIARGVDGACNDFVEASVSESHRAGKARGELTHVSAGRGLCESIKM